MSGVKEYYSTWMNATFKEYWLNQPGEIIRGELVSDYCTQIWRRLEAGSTNAKDYLKAGAFLNGLIVESWRTDRPDCGEIKGFAGLTYQGQNLIRIAHPYATASCYSHELGHQYFFSGMEALRPLYRALRGQDFTDRTPELERFAEDFKSLFGADGVAGVPNPEDDAAVLGNVRWAKDVPGLALMIKGWWPVTSRLKTLAYSNLQWIGCYMWRANGRWEAYGGNGDFYRWDGTKWGMI